MLALLVLFPTELLKQYADPGHTHGVTDPGHSHSIHTHGVNDLGHSHSISDPGHCHGWIPVLPMQTWHPQVVEQPKYDPAPEGLLFNHKFD